MWPNPQFSAGLVTFTEGIPIGKLQFFVQCKCKNETKQNSTWNKYWYFGRWFTHENNQKF